MNKLPSIEVITSCYPNAFVARLKVEDHSTNIVISEPEIFRITDHRELLFLLISRINMAFNTMEKDYYPEDINLDSYKESLDD